MLNHNNPPSNYSVEDFIIKYQAALKVGLSREQFAEYMGIVPDTVVRRRHKIITKTGLFLRILPKDPDYNGLRLDEIQEFEEKVEEITRGHYGPKRIESKHEKAVYLITSAQDSTPVEEKMWATLNVIKRDRNAELLVIGCPYNNHTSIYYDKTQKNHWWPSIKPHIVEDRIALCKGLEVMGEFKVVPTASRPLSGLESFGENSAIVGHPKVELKTVPTPSQAYAKILTTTGSCTVPNYTNTKAGQKGIHHHSLGAVIVEIDGDEFHIRHLHADDKGHIYDLDRLYTPTSVQTYDSVPAVIPGDIHAEFIDEDVESAIFSGAGSVVDVLKPNNMIYHDLDDFYARNHHHRNNDVLAFGKHHYGRNNVEQGLQISADFVDRHNREFMRNIIVRSNHDEAFDRWLREAAPKDDPENARFYHYMKYHQYINVKRTATGFSSFNAFEFWCNNPDQCDGLKSLYNTYFLKRDESFAVRGVELGFHGDVGANGARGSILGYSKIGPKVVIGHSHSPGICEGAYQVGVSAKLNLDYAKGPSSWMHTMCIVYPNGARTLVNIINGKWRGDR